MTIAQSPEAVPSTKNAGAGDLVYPNVSPCLSLQYLRFQTETRELFIFTMLLSNCAKAICYKLRIYQICQAR